jgi:beta-lactam-binding protein with PASTA domain
MSPESASLFPDLRGLSARDAARALARLGLGATLHGVGLVIAQRPDPGTPIERGASGTLWLERQGSARLVSDSAP